jgi:hypothetical protein
MTVLHRSALCLLALTSFSLPLAIGCSKSTSGTPAPGDSASAGASAPSAGAAAGSAGAGTPTLSMLTSGFEGEIDGTMQKPGNPPSPVTVLLKGDKLRFTIPEGMGKDEKMPMSYGIYDTAAKKITAVSDARKMAMVIDLNSGTPLGNMMSHAAPSASAGTAKPPPKITKTGRYETIAGSRCEDWELTSDHKEGMMCVAEQGVSWLSLPASIIPSEHAYMAELMDGKHFPLKMIGYEKDGTTEQMKIEVTKIDKKAVDDAQLQVPAGYNVMDLGKMMAGMGMGGGMGGMPPGMTPGMMPSGYPGIPPGAFSGRMGRPGPPKN